MSKQTAEILRQARELISDPERWCTDAYAEMPSLTGGLGEACNPTYSEACKWCAAGAVGKVTDDDDPLFNTAWRSSSLYPLEQAAQDLYGRHIEEVNDVLGHEAVMTMFDRAIRIAEEEPDNE